MKRITASFLMIALVLTVFAQAIDVTGKWNMKVETPAGSGSPVFVLKQSGETITGTYTGHLVFCSRNGCFYLVKQVS